MFNTARKQNNLPNFYSFIIAIAFSVQFPVTTVAFVLHQEIVPSGSN